MKKSIIILMVLTIIAKISGYLKNIVLAYFYGASEISDIFLISLSIPATVFGIIATGISTGYIPIYSKIEIKHSSNTGLEFTNNLITSIMIFCTFLVIISLIFTEYLVKVFAIGFEGETLSIATDFTRITIFSIYFIALYHILKSYLNYKNIFAIPSIVSLPMNLLLIIGITFSYISSNIIFLPISIVLSLLVQALILIILSFKNGYIYKFKLDLSDNYLKDMVTLAIPVIFGSSIMQINRLVDKSLASWITIGGVSSINYADMLNQAFIAIFVVSFATVLFPNISKKSAKGDFAGMKVAMNKTLVSVLILILPTTAFAMSFSSEIIEILFARGAFNRDAISLTSEAFYYYSIGLTGIAINFILTRVFYSLHDTKTPMINSSITMIINIFLSISLGSLMGIGGIALATSISSSLTALLLLLSLKKRLGNLNLSQHLYSFSKLIIATLLSITLTFMFHQFITNYINLTINIILSFIVMALIYITLIYLMRIEGVHDISNSVVSKLKEKL